MKNKKLNIIFLDFDDIKNPLLAAGQARATVEVGKRLTQKGHKITIICSKFPGFIDRTENGMSYKHIGLGTSNVRLNNLAYILALPFSVLKLRGDIVFEFFTAPISTLFSPLFTKIPVIAVPTSFEAERFAKLYHLPVDKIEKFGLRFYKYFMPYTSHLDFKMKKVNPNIISVVVPEGVGEEFFDIKKKRATHILFLGRFDIGQKGIDLLIKSYAKCNSKMQLPLVIAGVGPDKEKIAKLISKYNLTKKIVFMGPAYGKEKVALLEKAQYVVFPSRHEGFSLFALEALASGLPLVAFDIPSLEWADEKSVSKAKKFDIAEYSKKMITLSDKKVASKMSKEARKLAKKYTWENVANKYEQFSLDILKGI